MGCLLSFVWKSGWVPRENLPGTHQKYLLRKKLYVLNRDYKKYNFMRHS